MRSSDSWREASKKFMLWLRRMLFMTSAVIETHALCDVTAYVQLVYTTNLAVNGK